ncbi:MAG: hypothetical protein WEA84_14395 [Rhodovibrionaceae bacterium]
MTPTPASQTASQTPAPEIPAKFRDPETGALRAEALLQSYLELERKLARMIEIPPGGGDPAGHAPLRKALGIPDSPEGYAVTSHHELIQIDPEVNRVLHAAGFTPAQVQLVYDLAAERMIPAVQTLAGDFEAERQIERLCHDFGGEEKFQEIAKSIKAWGRQNLPPEVFDALSGTCEGVHAMHRMMGSGEPGLLGEGAVSGGGGEDELKRLMADRRYWRDKDPLVVRQVAEGFKRLYPEGGGPA